MVTIEYLHDMGAFQMSKRCIKNIACFGLIFLLICGTQSFSVQAAGNSISVDGNLNDWTGIAEYSGNGNISEWKVAFSEDKSTLYFAYTGSAASQWDASFLGENNQVNITYNSSAPDNKKAIRIQSWDKLYIKDGYNGDISGANFVVKNNAGNNVAGPYYVEYSVPTSFFADTNFTLTFAGTSVKASDIPSLGNAQTGGNEGEGTGPGSNEGEGTEKPTEPTEPVNPEPTEPVYSGIVIDGQFNDWDAVKKTDISDGKNWETVDQVAMVWDGDYVYLYFAANGKDEGWATTGDWGSVTGAGTHGSGNYAITTDLGNMLLVHLCADKSTMTGYIDGIPDAKVAVNNTAWDKAPHYWEVAIPADKLPAYKDSISFGFYQSEPVISGVQNLQGNDEEDKTFNGIEIDGSYGDWEWYPHELIQYATNGTQATVVDASGALWSDGGTLYGHVQTTMPQHLEEAGGEFTEAVTIRLNEDENKKFYPNFFTVDAEGNIDRSTGNLKYLEDGTYEFYISSTACWNNSTNINNLSAGDKIFGRMKVTIKDGKDEMEYELDLEAVAAFMNMDASDIKVVQARYRRIGNEWLTTAGTSTGPWTGVALCCAVAGCPILYRKRKKMENKKVTA